MCMCVRARSTEQTPNSTARLAITDRPGWLVDSVSSSCCLLFFFIVAPLRIHAAHILKWGASERDTAHFYERFHFNGIHILSYCMSVWARTHRYIHHHRHYGSPQRFGLASAGAHAHTHTQPQSLWRCTFFLFSYFLVSSSSFFRRCRRHHRCRHFSIYACNALRTFHLKMV